MKVIIKKIYLILKEAFRRFLIERDSIVSNGLAYKTLFAIIPVFALIISFSTILPSFETFINKLLDFILRYMLPGSVEKVRVLFNQILSSTKIFSIIGIAGTLYITLDLFIALDGVLNKIWATSDNRTLVNKILIYWSLLTATPIFLALYFYYSTVVRSMLSFFTRFTILDQFYYAFFSYIFVTAFIFFVYYVIPNTKVSAKKAAVVSLLASLVLIVFRFIFNFYTRIVVTTWVLYGSISVIIFFMLWVSLNWSIVLFGAQVLTVWQNKLYRNSERLKNFFLYDMALSLMIINDLKDDYYDKGKGVTIETIRDRYWVDTNSAIELLSSMEKSGLIYHTPEKRYTYHIKRDFRNIPVADIEIMLRDVIHGVHYQMPPKFNYVLTRLTKLYYRRNKNMTIEKILR